jgi:hypothetical protein
VTDQTSVFRNDVFSLTKIDRDAGLLSFEAVVFGRAVPIELDFQTAKGILERVLPTE